MNKTNNQKIWQSSSTQINKLVESYTVAEDYLIDLELLPYDIASSKAHATMLHSIGILNKQELESGISCLSEILSLWEQGDFSISPEQEDVHTAIEAYLTLKCKSFGLKIHTGRSRNDQVLVMLRLYMKDKYEVLLKLVDTLISTLDKAAVQYSTQQMPGYTHTQKAMPTFVGLWFESFKDGLHDIKNLLVGLEKLINQNPLGSASGFGISNFSNNRTLTTKLLKFAKVQENPLYCGYSRGYFENIFLQTFSPIVFLSSKFASDFILFSTQEFDFFSLPNEYTTGSSIMPQKRNYDLFEVMRANAKVYFSLQSQIQDIILTLGSGYHRDFQLTKKPFINGIKLIESTLELLIDLIPNIIVNNDKLDKAMTPDLFLTNKIYELVNAGLPFREAYRKVKDEIDFN